MPVRSKQLGIVNGTVAGEATVYTCPAGFRTIVKDVRLVSVATVPGVMFSQIRSGGMVPACPVLYVAAGATGQLYIAEAFAVMNAGDTLTVSVASVTGGGYALIASGAELEL